jgi:hypothetical protein
MNWSPRYTLAAGAGLILAVNVFALAGVAYNRSGEPESTLRLTERELRRPYQSWGFDRENSGLTLSLQWRVRTEGAEKERYYPFMDYYGDPVWLTPAKLAELGVDVSEPLDTERGKRRYQKLPSREVLLVLELDGENHRAALELARARAAREATAAAAKQLQNEEQAASRLFVVDAGRETRALRARYPDRTRYAIVQGRIQPRLSGEGKQARLRGYIEGLSIDHVNVPLELRPVFEGLAVEYGLETPSRRFEATVAHGRRLEPWLAGARKR